MRKHLALAAAALVAWKCAAPSPTPVTPPPIADGDGGFVGTPYAATCHHLHDLGCPEGAAADCARTLAHVDSTKLTLLPLACISAAHTAGDVRACGGFVTCRAVP